MDHTNTHTNKVLCGWKKNGANFFTCVFTRAYTQPNGCRHTIECVHTRLHSSSHTHPHATVRMQKCVHAIVCMQSCVHPTSVCMHTARNVYGHVHTHRVDVNVEGRLNRHGRTNPASDRRVSYCFACHTHTTNAHTQISHAHTNILHAHTRLLHANTHVACRFQAKKECDPSKDITQPRQGDAVTAPVVCGSAQQEQRRHWSPSLPAALRHGGCEIVAAKSVSRIGDSAVDELFPKTSRQPAVEILARVKPHSNNPLRVGICLSGGQVSNMKTRGIYGYTRTIHGYTWNDT